MKALAAVLLAATVLVGGTGCAGTKPEPKPTATVSFEECATEAFSLIKKELGVAFLVDHKAQANKMVQDACGDLYGK